MVVLWNLKFWLLEINNDICIFIVETSKFKVDATLVIPDEVEFLSTG